MFILSKQFIHQFRYNCCFALQISSALSGAICSAFFRNHGLYRSNRVALKVRFKLYKFKFDSKIN